MSKTQIYHRTANVKGRKIFYREAGDPTAPTILLLHGLPTSSQMFRDLVPALADRFHLVAPDYVGFGHSDAHRTKTSPILSTTWRPTCRVLSMNSG